MKKSTVTYRQAELTFSIFCAIVSTVSLYFLRDCTTFSYASRSSLGLFSMNWYHDLMRKSKSFGRHLLNHVVKRYACNRNSDLWEKNLKMQMMSSPMNFTFSRHWGQSPFLAKWSVMHFSQKECAQDSVLASMNGLKQMLQVLMIRYAIGFLSIYQHSNSSPTRSSNSCLIFSSRSFSLVPSLTCNYPYIREQIRENDRPWSWDVESRA